MNALAISLRFPSFSSNTFDPIKTPNNILVSLAGATTVSGAYFKASNTKM